MKLLLFLLLTLLSLACTPQARLSRLIKRHPELTRVDTVRTNDTLISHTYSTDTLFSALTLNDTVYITKDKLHIKYVRYHDTVYVSGMCLPDTIIKQISIPTQRIVQVVDNSKFPWWYWLFMAILVVLLFTTNRRRY